MYARGGSTSGSRQVVEARGGHTLTCPCGASFHVHVSPGLGCVDVVDEIDNILLLDNITLCFPRGSSTAIISSPGAGVTTLLRFMAGRLSGSAHTIKSGGAPGVIGASGHVAQHDVHENLLTTRETLELVFALSRNGNNEQTRRDGGGSGESEGRERVGPAGVGVAADTDAAAGVGACPPPLCQQCSALNVDETLSLLGLDECADVRAGKLSGGQRRRLSIGEVLVTPAGSARGATLLLDCPVSGVDSLMAYTILVSGLATSVDFSGRLLPYSVGLTLT